MILGAFYDQETEGMVYWIPPGGEQEPKSYSDDESSDSEDSIASSHTITSNEFTNYFCEVNGRLFVNDPDVLVWYPVDEHRRLKLRHQLLKLLHGGNHFGKMAEVLSACKDRRPRVLDMCTRDGSWVSEMSQEFPHVEFVSVDVAPVVAHTPQENILYEVYDVHRGILEHDNSFDLVWISCITEVVKDVPEIIREAQRVLKPGGLLCMVEPELALYDSQDISRHSLDLTPLTWRAIDAVRSNLITQGAQLEDYRLATNWLSPGSIFWRDKNPSSLLSFERITAGTKVAHAGGWDSDNERQEIRLLLAQLGTTYWRNMVSMLTLSGTSDREATDLVNGAIRELKNPCTQYALKFHHVFAYKGQVLRTEL
ncbi:hypothetical protein FRC12_000227 [Ceratobasidium sp. 428]|nr:hypothetical protein FRC12_000227 [Ceratobasidium sp. 428]